MAAKEMHHLIVGADEFEVVDELARSAGFVDTVNLADDAVTEDKLADGAVTGEKIADDGVTTDAIADGAVTEDKLGAGAVTVNKIGTGAVATAKIADGAVTTGKLNSGAVTNVKLADGAVTTDKIADANVTNGKLASNAVTTAKINDGAVTTDKIANSSVTTAKIKGGAVRSVELADGAVTPSKIAFHVQDIESKNVANILTLVQGSLSGTGAETTGTTRLRSGFFSVDSSVVYTVSMVSSALFYEIHEYDSSKTWLKFTQVNANSATFTTSGTTKYVRILFRYSDNSTILPSAITKLQLEKGSTVTSYVPYAKTNVELSNPEAPFSPTRNDTYLGGQSPYCVICGKVAMVRMAGLTFNDAATQDCVLATGLPKPVFDVTVPLYVRNASSYVENGVVTIDTSGQLIYRSGAKNTLYTNTITYIIA